MPDLNPIAKWLIVTGLLLAGVGVLLALSSKMPWVGRLPGDIYIKRGNFTFYFPLVTCLALSFLLTLLWNLFKK